MEKKNQLESKSDCILRFYSFSDSKYKPVTHLSRLELNLQPQREHKIPCSMAANIHNIMINEGLYANMN